MAKVCFLLGIMPRCGTNVLENYLRLHPDCSAPGPVWEDFLVSSTTKINPVLKQLQGRWDNYWFRDTTENYLSRLERCIGQGLVSFLLSQLNEGCDVKYLISKTPTVKGLNNYQRFFSGERLVVIVRDGRSLIESGQRSFDWNFEKAAFDWAKNARNILAFTECFPDSACLVKYEQLCSDTPMVLEKICNYMLLDYRKYPIDDAMSLPVSGSSDLKENGGKLHWKPTEKTKEFNSLNRFSAWSVWRHKVFNFFAAKEMIELGYVIENRNSFLDQLMVAVYLGLSPLWILPYTAYKLIVNKTLVLKTN